MYAHWAEGLAVAHGAAILPVQVLGVKEYHRSCQDNLSESMEELGLSPPEVPSPLNLWMNVPWKVVNLLVSSHWAAL